MAHGGSYSSLLTLTRSFRRRFFCIYSRFCKMFSKYSSALYASWTPTRSGRENRVMSERLQISTRFAVAQLSHLLLTTQFGQWRIGIWLSREESALRLCTRCSGNRRSWCCQSSRFFPELLWPEEEKWHLGRLFFGLRKKPNAASFSLCTFSSAALLVCSSIQVRSSRLLKNTSRMSLIISRIWWQRQRSTTQ